MCKYAILKEGKCQVTKEICPYLYYCNHIMAYKESKSMPDLCKVAKQYEAPKDAYEVCFERRKRLYVNIGDKIEIVPNPYDYVPSYVKMTKLKSGEWRIEDAMR